MTTHKSDIKTLEIEAGRLGIIDPDTGKIREDTGISNLKDLLDSLEKKGIEIEDPFEGIGSFFDNNKRDEEATSQISDHKPGDQHPPEDDNNNDNPDASESPNAGLGSLRGYFSERGAGYSGNNDDEEESGPAPNPRDEDIPDDDSPEPASKPEPNPRDEDIPDDNNDDSREEETGPPANGIDKAKDPTQGYDGSTDPRNGGDGDGGDSSSSSSSSSSSGHKPGDQHPPDSTRSSSSLAMAA